MNENHVKPQIGSLHPVVRRISESETAICSIGVRRYLVTAISVLIVSSVASQPEEVLRFYGARVGFGTIPPCATSPTGPNTASRGFDSDRREQFDQPSPKGFQCTSKTRRAKRFARFCAHSRLNCRFEGGISVRGEPSGEDICRGPRAAAARNFAPLRAKLRTVLSE